MEDYFGNKFRKQNFLKTWIGNSKKHESVQTKAFSKAVLECRNKQGMYAKLV